jgi:gamma-glutamyltranspeptidase/glutathione hydrolase
MASRTGWWNDSADLDTGYRGYEVYQSPPNSGGIVMLEALNILEGYDLKKFGHYTPRVEGVRSPDSFAQNDDPTRVGYH